MAKSPLRCSLRSRRSAPLRQPRRAPSCHLADQQKLRFWPKFGFRHRKIEKKYWKKKFLQKVLIFYFSNTFYSQPLKVSLPNSSQSRFSSKKNIDFAPKLSFRGLQSCRICHIFTKRFSPKFSSCGHTACSFTKCFGRMRNAVNPAPIWITFRGNNTFSIGSLKNPTSLDFPMQIPDFWWFLLDFPI